MVKNSGFSLLEILVALTLLGIIGAFVGGKVLDQLHEGRVKAARIQMGNFATVLKDFRRKCHSYPTTSQGLEALASNPGGGCKNYPPDGFLESIPLDPWDEEYNYESDGKTFEIWSFGPDGLEGGEGNDEDIFLNKGNKKRV